MGGFGTYALWAWVVDLPFSYPFEVTFGLGDIRLTTRYDEDDLNSLFTAMHETGHALYEQGIPKEWWSLPIGDVRSLGLHESQSRIWEIQVGTGRVDDQGRPLNVFATLAHHPRLLKRWAAFGGIWWGSGRLYIASG